MSASVSPRATTKVRLPRFVAGVVAAFAVFTLLPGLWLSALAGLLTPGSVVEHLVAWAPVTALTVAGAVAGTVVALRLARRRMLPAAGVAPRGATVLGLLAGSLAGLAYLANASAELWSLFLSVTYDLGLRGTVGSPHAMATLITWAVFAVAATLAGAGAVGLLYFPWLTGAPARSTADHASV